MTINIKVKISGLEDVKRRYGVLGGVVIANKVSGRVVANANKIRNNVTRNITTTAKNPASANGLRAGALKMVSSGKFERSLIDYTRNASGKPYGEHVNNGDNFNAHNAGFVEKGSYGIADQMKREIEAIIKKELEK